MKKTILIKLTILLYIVTVLHVSALYFFWYWDIWWFDILVHFLGGAWVGGMAYVLFFRNMEERVGSPGGFWPYLPPILAVVVIGTLWELFEFSLDTFIIFQSNDIVDTLSDIGADIAGGLCAVFLIMRRVVSINN